MFVRPCVGLAASLLLSACAAKRVPPPEEVATLHRQCREAMTAGEYGDARLFCQAASTQAPQFAEAWQDLGISLLLSGSAAEAKAPLEKARSLDDRLWRTHNGLGILAFMEKDHGRADGHFKRAAELNPDAPEPRYNRAWNYFRWDRLREAKEELRPLVKKHPALGYPVHLLGVLLLTEDELARATEAMVEALAREPGECRNWLGMGNAYYAEGRHEEAETAIATCVELCPERPECGAALESAQDREAFPLATPRDLIP